MLIFSVINECILLQFVLPFDHPFNIFYFILYKKQNKKYE